MPCGTPETTPIKLNFLPSPTTLCCLSYIENSKIQSLYPSMAMFADAMSNFDLHMLNINTNGLVLL